MANVVMTQPLPNTDYFVSVGYVDTRRKTSWLIYQGVYKTCKIKFINIVVCNNSRFSVFFSDTVRVISRLSGLITNDNDI